MWALSKAAGGRSKVRIQNSEQEFEKRLKRN